MKYSDYKEENLVFLTKTDWTEEEMREVLDTFPESKDTEKVREAVKEIIEAIDHSIIKVNTWGAINKTSAKAYANKHEYVEYGRIRRNPLCISSPDNEFYVYIDGYYETIDYKSDAKNIIKYLEEDDIKKRFNNVVRKYREREERYKKAMEVETYEKENRERIIANRIADCYLSKFELRILKSYENYKYSDEDIPSYSTEDKTLRGSAFTWHNSYGEIEFYNKVLSKEDAEKIIEIIKEANRKVELIMDRVDIELREIKEKYKED